MELTPKQKAGLKLVQSSIRKKYPFVLGMTINMGQLELYGTMVGVDIHIDLEKMYKFTNTHSPRRYDDHPTLYGQLKEPRGYLLIYMDDEFHNEYGSDFNNKFEKSMNTYYKNLPPGMCISKFEGWDDQRLIDQTNLKVSPDFYIKWRDEKEPVDLRIDKFVPVINKGSKYYTED